jgi:hypothetical protein
MASFIMLVLFLVLRGPCAAPGASYHLAKYLNIAAEALCSRQRNRICNL